jgi:hypothetical protein
MKAYNKDNKSYIVYSDGKIWSNARNRFCKNSLNRDGYIQSSIGLVHRILATCFIDNPYNKKEVNHVDGNKLNNLLSNLEWCTRAENVKHAYDNKLYNTKLDYKLASNIRDEYSTGNISSYKLAKKYNVSQSTIMDILKQKIWKN